MRASCPLCGSLEQVMLLTHGPDAPPEEIVDCPRHGSVSISDPHVLLAEAGAFDEPDEPLPGVLQGLAETIAAAARIMAAYDWTGSAPEPMVSTILTVRILRDELAEVERRITQAIEASTVRGQLIECRGKDWKLGASPKVRYDVRRVVSALAARLADEVVDQESGEVPPVGVIAETVATAVAEATGSLAPSAKWNKTPLAQHGIDLDAFETERSYGRTTLREDYKR